MNDAFWNPACHITISLWRDVSCIHIPLRFIGEKGTSVKSKKEQCDFETCHDRKELEFQTQEPLAIPSRGGSWSKLTRQVEEFEANGKRSLLR